MSAQHEPSAVAIARAHVEAWGNHEFDTARGMLAPDVQVTSTTTQPIMKDVRTTGIDDYMSGLIAFAQGVVPGSARVLVRLFSMLARDVSLTDGIRSPHNGGRMAAVRANGRLVE